jgi:large subunit ribosomal protein L13
MPKTYTIDASNKILGRLAAEAAVLLRGKNEADFAANKICGNRVIVFNTTKIIYKGKKLENKRYYTYSGYPGGIHSIKLKDLIKKDPSAPLRKAVFDMLPKNKLRGKFIKNLKLYAQEIEKE